MKEGWEIKKIKDICDKASSNIAMNKITDIDGIYPVYGASGFVQNVDFFHRDTPYIGIVKDGAGVGRVNVYPAYSSLLGTLQYILPKEGNSINYVAYALKSLNLASSVTGATIPHIYFKDYGEITLPVPPLSEQERIVSELDLISGVIEKKKQQLKELDSLAQSIFYEMFGNPVENEKGWEKIPFEKSIEKVKYTTKIPSCNYCGEGMFPIISQEDEYISGFWNNSDDVFRISKPIVIFGDHTRILKYIDFDFVLGADGVKILQPVDSINARFFKLYLELSKIPSLGYSRHYKLLKELNVFTPPLSLQEEFASKIEMIEKQKELIKESIKETETLFNSRMDYYFNS